MKFTTGRCIVALAILAVALMISGPALAQGSPHLEAQSEVTDTGGDSGSESGSGSLDLPISLSLTMGNTIGFQKENDLYVMSFIGSLTYMLPAEISATVNGGFAKELSNSDSTTYYRETEFQDVGLAFSRSLYTIPVVNINLALSSRFNFPTSKPSRYQTLYLGWTNTLNVSKSMFGFNLGYSFGFKKNFHQYTTGEIQPNDEGVTPEIRGTSFEEALGQSGVLTPFIISDRSPDLLNTGHANTSYMFINTFSVTYNFIESLSANGTFATINSRAYEVANDIPRGERDSFLSSFSINYTPIQYLTLSGGIQTVTPQLRPDSSGYYNPFFVNNYYNPTTMFVNLTGII